MSNKWHFLKNASSWTDYYTARKAFFIQHRSIENVTYIFWQISQDLVERKKRKCYWIRLIEWAHASFQSMKFWKKHHQYCLRLKRIDHKIEISWYEFVIIKLILSLIKCLDYNLKHYLTSSIGFLQANGRL